MADRLARKKKQQKRNLTILGGLGLLLLLIWVRNYANSTGNAVGAATTDSTTTAEIQKLQPLPVVFLERPENLKENPFDISAFGPELASVEQTVDVKIIENTEPDRDAIIAEAEKKIDLQAAMVGKRSTAYVNNSWRTIGDSVEGFQITEIGSRSITVTRDDVSVVIWTNLDE